ncbi:hypothetical protein BDZ89DRAFT_1149683 [Hymenopellis radicata]|nr:hypothetical protein BDZ89DRAFT_1149683 [Hymenopellis radicata]
MPRDSLPDLIIFNLIRDSLSLTCWTRISDCHPLLSGDCQIHYITVFTVLALLAAVAAPVIQFLFLLSAYARLIPTPEDTAVVWASPPTSAARHRYLIWNLHLGALDKLLGLSIKSDRTAWSPAAYEL